MPRCFVPGCNYGVDTYKGPHRAVFGFPLDPEKKRLWIEAIRRTDLAPTVYSQVCDRHFDPALVQHGAQATRTIRRFNGTTITKVVHGRSKLDANAVPTLFLDEPLLERGPITEKKKGRGAVASKKRAADVEDIPEDILDGSAPRPHRTKRSRVPPPNVALQDINGLIALIETPPPAPVLSEKWLITLTKPSNNSPGGVVFYQFDPQSSMPTILRSVTVDSKLDARAYYQNQQIPSQAFQEYLNPTMSALKVETWNKLMDLLDKLDKYAGESYVFDFEPKEEEEGRVEEYGRALATLEDRRKALIAIKTGEAAEDTTTLKDPRELSKLNFIMEQIGLLDSQPNHRSYSIPLYEWTEYIIRRSPEVCRFLEQSGALTLPRMRLEYINLNENKVKAKRRARLRNPVVLEYEGEVYDESGLQQIEQPIEQSEVEAASAAVQYEAGVGDPGEAVPENGLTDEGQEQQAEDEEPDEDQMAASALEGETA